MSLTLNKNSIYGDRSAVSPGGVRIGTPALTTRGFKEADFERVAEFLRRAVVIALDIQATTGCKTVVDFCAAFKGRADLQALRADVQALATSFPMPGFDVASMKYKSACGGVRAREGARHHHPASALLAPSPPLRSNRVSRGEALCAYDFNDCFCLAKTWVVQVNQSLRRRRIETQPQSALQRQADAGLCNTEIEGV